MPLPQATSAYQSPRLRLRQRRAAHAATIVRMISATATQEIDAVEGIVIRVGGVGKQKIIQRAQAPADGFGNGDPLLFVDGRQQIESGQRRAEKQPQPPPSSRTRSERRCHATTTISNARE